MGGFPSFRCTFGLFGDPLRMHIFNVRIYAIAVLDGEPGFGPLVQAGNPGPSGGG
jgi:hypothetical protein